MAEASEGEDGWDARGLDGFEMMGRAAGRSRLRGPGVAEARLSASLPHGPAILTLQWSRGLEPLPQMRCGRRAAARGPSCGGVPALPPAPHGPCSSRSAAARPRHRGRQGSAGKGQVSWCVEEAAGGRAWQAGATFLGAWL